MKWVLDASVRDEVYALDVDGVRLGLIRERDYGYGARYLWSCSLINGPINNPDIVARMGTFHHSARTPNDSLVESAYMTYENYHGRIVAANE